jgi:hypothetical protein
MANAVYPKALEGFLKADIDMDSDIRLALVDAGAYTYSATHQFVSDLSGVIARSTALQSKTMTGGAFDCDDIVVTGVSRSSCASCTRAATRPPG